MLGGDQRAGSLSASGIEESRFRHFGGHRIEAPDTCSGEVHCYIGSSVLDVIVVGILLEKRGTQYFTVIFERKPKYGSQLEVTTRAVARKAASGGGAARGPTRRHCTDRR